MIIAEFSGEGPPIAVAHETPKWIGYVLILVMVVIVVWLIERHDRQRREMKNQ